MAEQRLIDAKCADKEIQNSFSNGCRWKGKTDGGDMPTIEERKKGKWIPFEFGDDTWHKCTACGVADNYISIVQRQNGTTGRLKSVRNFCPNCGARMGGRR